MNNNTNSYIKDSFIDLNINKIPFSFYVIRQSLLNAINELKPKIHGTVLDLACGVMPYKNYLLNSNVKEYIGIDLEPTNYHNIVKPDLYWDGQNIPLEDSYCDYVIATEFFEHYYDTKHIMKEIRRVLKPDGILFFTVPAIWPLHENPFDYHRFTPYFLEKCFEETGFSSWKVKSLGGYHLVLALSLSIWNDFKLSKVSQKFFRPLLKPIIMRLINKDKIKSFDNGIMYSGLYGFVIK